MTTSSIFFKTLHLASLVPKTMASTATTDHPFTPNNPNSIVINGDVTINYNYNFIDSHFPSLASNNTTTTISNISNLNINGTCYINCNINTVPKNAHKDQVQVSKLSKWIKPLLSFLVFLFTLFAGGCQLVVKKEWKFSL